MLSPPPFPRREVSFYRCRHVNTASAVIQAMNRRLAAMLNIIDTSEKPVVCRATPDASRSFNKFHAFRREMS